MSAKTLFVGVDVAEEGLDVFFMDQDEKALTSPHHYPNLPEGFRLLRQDTLAFSHLLGKSVPIVIGFESTGNYHKNLEAFFKRRKGKRFTGRTLNPYPVKQFRKAHFTLSSTDRISAKVIAKFLKASLPLPFFSFSCAASTSQSYPLSKNFGRGENKIHQQAEKEPEALLSWIQKGGGEKFSLLFSYVPLLLHQLGGCEKESSQENLLEKVYLPFSSP
ncbi:hypothetical protein DRI96_05900 [Candidatus Aerophobetes bacterium]|uniref:Transposase IS110-like N-terminal domain-containing protein n=1 Tax=Aerophobetes bacterium TaxID=2030807 RepID=A0A662D764_UNCAE|nr:MAG: hypothetical protein DRI96_05900 [Candidatus Aerophobetes bacterium]